MAKSKSTTINSSPQYPRKTPSVLLRGWQICFIWVGGFWVMMGGYLMSESSLRLSLMKVGRDTTASQASWILNELGQQGYMTEARTLADYFDQTGLGVESETPPPWRPELQLYKELVEVDQGLALQPTAVELLEQKQVLLTRLHRDQEAAEVGKKVEELTGPLR